MPGDHWGWLRKVGEVVGKSFGLRFRRKKGTKVTINHIILQGLTRALHPSPKSCCD